MKRSWLRRKTPLRRSPKPINTINKARKKKRADEDEVYGSYHRYVSSLRCILWGRRGHKCWGRVGGHHVKTVGSGGKDAANLVPLCVPGHWLAHQQPWRFLEDFDIDLELEADAIYREWAA